MSEQTSLLPANAEGVAYAAKHLRAGELVAVPTETVYGLAARADSAEAVAKIYRAKGRPDFNPLIVHVATLDQAREIAEFDEQARALAERFWPGPLTLVLRLKQSASIAPAVTSGLPTIALRMPAHPVMQAVLRETGLPLAAPSANRSGGVSPTRAEHVMQSLGGRIGLVLDGGTCPQGIESTILATGSSGCRILRPGPIENHAFSDICPDVMRAGDGPIEAPGQLASHYSPGKPMRLGAKEAGAGEFMVGFGTIAGDCTLTKSGDLAEAAANLYACLHEAAASPHPMIAVAPVPTTGIGEAINDRLRRAAA
jgi:L-threonylcarbamoyladenylate synthase